VPKGQQQTLVLLDQLEIWDQLAKQGLLVPKGLQQTRVPLGPKDRSVQLALLGPKDRSVLQAHKAILAHKVILDYKATLVFLVVLVILAHKETLVTQGPPAPQDCLE
jgi:hypothetical protein